MPAVKFSGSSNLTREIDCGALLGRLRCAAASPLGLRVNRGPAKHERCHEQERSMLLWGFHP